MDEALPVAGGAGALILALAGVGMAVRRRRRREDEEADLDMQHYAENTDAALQPMAAEEPEPEPAPSWSEPVIQPKADPIMPARMEPTAVSDDFNTSGFGRHVQAAYAGQTPENPSLSLRKRLKLATELDRRERKRGGIRKRSSKPVTMPLPANERMAMPFGEPKTGAKRPEFQF
jgi:MYXO-CTERM domain-containing protein